MTRVHAVTLSVLIALVIATIFAPQMAYVAGAVALLAGALGFPMLAPRPKIVLGVLVGVGIAGIVIAAVGGWRPSADTLLGLNQDLIGMLAATTFVRLVMPSPTEKRQGFTGFWALVRTTYVVHLFSSVISLSAVYLAGHRLSGNGRLSLPNALVLSRSFSTAGFWSPFWVASAAAATALPGVDLGTALLIGAAVAAIVLMLGTLDVAKLLGSDLRGYRGYSLQPALLAIPVAMVVIVLGAHAIAPEVPIPQFVALAAIVVTLILCLARGRRGLVSVARYATSDLSSVRSETSLFAAAAILATGLRAAFDALGVALPFDTYTLPLAYVGMAAIIVLGVCGVHPIVAFSIASSLLLPLQPNPTVFVVASMLGWGAATMVNATSGVALQLSSQFAVPVRPLVLRNFFVVAGVLVLAVPALLLAQAVG